MLKILGKAKPTDKAGLPNTRDWDANRQADLTDLELIVSSPEDIQAILNHKVSQEFTAHQVEVDQALLCSYILPHGLKLSSFGIPFIVTHASSDFSIFYEAYSEMFEGVKLGFELLPSTNLQRMREEACTTPEEIIEYVKLFRSAGVDAFACVDENHLAQTEHVRLFEFGRTLSGIEAPLYKEHERFLFDDRYWKRVKSKAGRSLNEEIDRALSGSQLCISELFFTKGVKNKKTGDYEMELPKLLVPAFESSIEMLGDYAKGFASVSDHKLVCRIGEPAYDPKWSYAFQFLNDGGNAATADLFKTHLHLVGHEYGDFKPVLPQLIKATASLTHINGLTIETNDKNPDLLRQDKEYLMKLI